MKDLNEILSEWVELPEDKVFPVMCAMAEVSIRTRHELFNTISENNSPRKLRKRHAKRLQRSGIIVRHKRF